jgi:hypothetical protein
MRSREIYNRSKYDSAMLVIGRDAGSQVFYDREFFLKMVQSIYSVIAVLPEAYGYQTAILMTRI